MEAGLRPLPDPTLALVSADYAEIFIERDTNGDSKKAAELQDEAMAMAMASA